MVTITSTLVTGEFFGCKIRGRIWNLNARGVRICTFVVIFKNARLFKKEEAQKIPSSVAP